MDQILHLLHSLMVAPWFWAVVAVGGFFLLLFVTSVLERRYTCPYVPVRVAGAAAAPLRAGEPPPTLDYADATPDASELPEYVRIMSDDAHASGFLFDRLVAHVKAPQVRILATVWYSPDRRTVLLSGAGTVARAPAFQTWLFTPLKDGRFLVTTDNNDEGDRSGLYRMKRVIRMRFDKLLAVHDAQIEKFGPQVTSFEESSALDALLAIYQRRADRLVARGSARYTSEDRLYWHYTGWGGLRNCLGFFVQLAQTVPQAVRVQRPPIGSHHWVSLGQTVYARYAGSAPVDS
ncbi:MAG TPA: hypothetical protein VH475_28390 [Tepidisphaeraceae bacterium]|jgi:hypothetical protein